MRFALALSFLVSCAGEPAADTVQTPPVEPPAPVMRSSHDPVTGELVRRWAVVIHSDGRVERNGRETRWFSDRSLQAEREYLDDRPVGTWRSWFADGTLRSEYTYDGSATPMLFFHESGAPAAEGPARAGTREGDWRFWRANGNLRQHGRYVGGIKVGVWTLYHENGGLRSRGTFVADRRVGEWKHWKEWPPTLISDWQPPAGDARDDR